MKGLDKKVGILQEKILLNEDGCPSNYLLRLVRIDTTHLFGDEKTNDLRLMLSVSGESSDQGGHFAGEYQSDVEPEECESLFDEINTIEEFSKKCLLVRKNLSETLMPNSELLN